MSRGGARPGAGRPAGTTAIDPRRIIVAVRLTDGEAAALDAARGEVSRPDAAREAILRGLGAQEEIVDQVHVTRITGRDVYGHVTDHCDESGCNGNEIYFKALDGEAISVGDVVDSPCTVKVPAP